MVGGASVEVPSGTVVSAVDEAKSNVDVVARSAVVVEFASPVQAAKTNKDATNSPTRSPTAHPSSGSSLEATKRHNDASLQR